MSRQRLPSFTIETGLCFRRAFREFEREVLRNEWILVGRLQDSTPFQLEYWHGVSRWTCAADLGRGIRKKILDALRELRYAEELPDHICHHDVKDDDRADFAASTRRVNEITQAFQNDIWRRQYLGERDEDYAWLAVPFAEKEDARALGAEWDRRRRAWKVHKDKPIESFARWVPAPDTSADLAQTPTV